MSKPPFRRTSDPRQAAEAAFKAVTTKPVPAPLPKRPAATTLPGVRETVSLRIDRDVLDHFQADGPGWQERINEALRAAAGLRKPGPADEGLRPDQLTTENDQ
ncbi:MAG TPA: BrnA antitoxin family protein [Microvirga sp.]|jgi:uncharacterized protein (DUF4415 family)|nr:BrnA antitoxin family protein [Microvirga sp.]